MNFAKRLLENKNNAAVAGIAINEIFEGFYSTGNQNIFVNYDDAAGGVDAFKTWLASNPVTVLYELATPVQEAFAMPTLTSYNPNTSVHHDSTEAGLITWHVLKGGGSGNSASEFIFGVENGIPYIEEV